MFVIVHYDIRGKVYRAIGPFDTRGAADFYIDEHLAREFCAVVPLTSPR